MAEYNFEHTFRNMSASDISAALLSFLAQRGARLKLKGPRRLKAVLGSYSKASSALDPEAKKTLSIKVRQGGPDTRVVGWLRPGYLYSDVEGDAESLLVADISQFLREMWLAVEEPQAVLPPPPSSAKDFGELLAEKKALRRRLAISAMALTAGLLLFLTVVLYVGPLSDTPGLLIAWSIIFLAVLGGAQMVRSGWRLRVIENKLR